MCNIDKDFISIPSKQTTLYARVSLKSSLTNQDTLMKCDQMKLIG